MKIILCKALFVIIKANSSYHMDQGWWGPGGEVTHESKELQQDDSNPKSIFWGCGWIRLHCYQQDRLHWAHNNCSGQRWDALSETCWLFFLHNNVDATNIPTSDSGSILVGEAHWFGFGPWGKWTLGMSFWWCSSSHDQLVHQRRTNWKWVFGGHAHKL